MHIRSSSAKSVLLNALNEEAKKNVGNQQTFTIIEWAKENYDAIITPHLLEDNTPSRLESMNLDDNDRVSALYFIVPASLLVQ